MVEQEFFNDNQKLIKYENAKIERARKAEEDANEKLEELIPRLES